MAIRSKTLGRVGSVLTLLCLTALLISFSSDRWVQSSGKDNVGFENLGLWSVCLNNYYPPDSALVHRQYDGCWWVLNKELDDLRDFLIPSWFRTTQVLVTLSLVLVLVVIILLVVNLINCFPHSPFRYLIKRILAIAASLLLILTAILLFIAILVFGLKSSNTGNGWLQNNDENYLSWSFGMCILADFLAVLAGMVILLQFMRHRAEKDDTEPDPKIIVTNERPPPAPYEYSRSNVSQGGRPMTEKVAPRDPAYVQMYKNRDESKVSLISPPTEMFAVSGRGEVYVNNLATYEDNNRRNQPAYHQNGPPPRRDDQRNNTQSYSAPSQRNGSQPNAGTRSGRQLGRQGVPLRLQEPNFLRSQREGDGSQSGSVYEDGEYKSSRHKSIPEYVPKSKSKPDITATEDDSYVENDSDNASTASKKKRRQKGNDANGGGEKRESRRKTRSTSRPGEKDSVDRSRSRSRSNSRSRKKNRNESDTDGGTPSQRRRSKKKKKHRSSSVKGDSTDEEQTSRRRSRSRKNSRSRSQSKDRFTSDSQLDSDTGSTHSRSSRRKKRKEKEFSRMDAKRRSASEDNLSVRSGGSRRKSKKRHDGNVSDDFSGSEYSQRRSRRKGGRQSEGETRGRQQRDYSDNDSVKSRSKRSGNKPKGTYSSYYEY